MDIQNSKVRPCVEGFPKGEDPAGGASQPSASGSGPFFTKEASCCQESVSEFCMSW